MNLALKKMCHANNEKQKKDKTTEGKELPVQQSIRKLGEKENYKYLGIFGADSIKLEIKETIRKKYLRKTRKLLETTLWKQKSRQSVIYSV